MDDLKFNSAGQLEISNGVDMIQKAIEQSLYGGPNEYARHKLCNLLGKLGIKSARSGLAFGHTLKIESLDATLKQVTFEMTYLKNWKMLQPKVETESE